MAAPLLLPTELEGPLLLQPAVLRDERGFFCESYSARDLAQVGITDEFVQDNHSRSARRVVRGMHFQLGEGVSKLVRCGRGAILDVVVDIRTGSPDFGRWEAFTLTGENVRQLYVPVGFAHGFTVLSDDADVLYKQSGYYDPELESGIAFDDPDIGIVWPDQALLIASNRDRTAPRLAQVAGSLPFRYAASDS